MSPNGSRVPGTLRLTSWRSAGLGLCGALLLAAGCGSQPGTGGTTTTCTSGCGGAAGGGGTVGTGGGATGGGATGGGGAGGTLSEVLSLGNSTTVASLAFDGARYVYLACGLAVCRVDLTAPAAALLPVAGSDQEGGAVDGAGAAARFADTSGVAWDGARYVYVADQGNHTIRRVDTQAGASFGAVITVAGAAGLSGNADGTAAARFQHPLSVAHDGARYLYVAEWSDIPMGMVTGYAGTLRQVDTQAGPGFGAVVTVAGNPAESAVVDGTGSAARLGNPTGLAHDHAGHLYLTDADVVRRLDTAAGSTFGAVTTVAGLAHAGATLSVDGVGSAARFVFPQGVSHDGAGFLYVADLEDATVRRVDVRAGATYGAVTTVVGKAGEKGDLDLGPLATARMNMPSSVAWLGGGSLLITDVYVHALLRADGL